MCEASQTCGAVAKATPIGVGNGGLDGAGIGSGSKMGKLRNYSDALLGEIWYTIPHDLMGIVPTRFFF